MTDDAPRSDSTVHQREKTAECEPELDSFKSQATFQVLGEGIVAASVASHFRLRIMIIEEKK